MGCLALILPILLVLPLIFLLILVDIIRISFGKLGLSSGTALALLVVTLLGSMVNIPVSSRRIVYEQPLPFTPATCFTYRRELTSRS